MNVSRQRFCATVLILLVFRPGLCPAWVTDPNISCTWGIANSDLSIPAGSAPVGAILTLHNVYTDPSVSGRSVAVHLLNNPVPGLTEFAEVSSSDPFETHGARMGIFPDPAAPGEDLTIDFAQVDDPQSWTRLIFGTPFSQTLGNQDQIDYSSSLLELTDYAGSGQSFGIGVYPQGIVFSGITLQITVQSLIDASSPQIFEYQYGNIYAPQLEAIGNYSITRGQMLRFIVNASDGDGDVPLAYTVEGLPPGAFFEDQTFTWTPTETQGGIWTLTFGVSDGLLTDSKTILITVRTINHPPVLDFPQQITISEKDYLVFPVSASDPDGDPVSITAANLPGGAVFDGSALTWRTFFGDFGTYTITFIASDGLTESTDNLILTVLPAKATDWYKKH